MTLYDIIIKETNKDSGTVILEREDHLAETRVQLEDMEV